MSVPLLKKFCRESSFFYMITHFIYFSIMKSLLLIRSAMATGICAISLIFSSCSLDYANPNAATEAQVLSTREGLLGLAIGMQQFYAANGTGVLESYITRSGVTARELVVTTTFQNPLDLEVGGSALPTENGDILAIWQRSYRVISMADNILSNVPKLTDVQLPPPMRSGTLALASLYKAMCLGHLVMYFEQAPITVGTLAAPAPFRNRADVLAEALRLLDDAARQIATTAPNTEFTTTVLARGLNLSTTIQAMRARFLLMAGRNADAIQAATAVPQAAASVSNFTFDAQQNRNPIFLSIVQAGSSYAPRDFFGVAGLDTNDQRLRFFMSLNATRFGNASRLPADNLVAPFFAAVDASIPVFRLGEMLLIRAEANARLGNLMAAVEDINRIRTKARTADPHGIGAALPAYSGAMAAEAVLAEIYAQRCVELYLTGMRMEDARRFGRPAPPTMPVFTSERNRNFYPYPSLERDNNRVNTPPDPAI
ncbi:MAG: RagB/SusD family nutrient uptake outer membrane protein [Candidatus Kapaibacterium sp.]|nr:MAG: RagB/SusD family nutrient uptake outer membrane protein [Candidatus Kapabacteria bacterium]